VDQDRPLRIVGSIDRRCGVRLRGGRRGFRPRSGCGRIVVVVHPHADHRRDRITHHGVSDGLALGVVLVVLATVTAESLANTALWNPDSSPPAAWCPPTETPNFSLGFADLAQQLGSIMGQPTECEHGETGSNDTFQQTTTGLAVYDWCTNTPSFVRGREHWMLAPGGVVHWSDSDTPPVPRPTVRAPDLRYLCPA
jgi:hypothetical protein